MLPGFHLPAGWAGNPGLFDPALSWHVRLPGGESPRRHPNPTKDPAEGTDQSLAGCGEPGRGLPSEQTMLLFFEGLMAEGMGLQGRSQSWVILFFQHFIFPHTQPSQIRTSCTKYSPVSGESFAVNKPLTELNKGEKHPLSGGLKPPCSLWHHPISSGSTRSKTTAFKVISSCTTCWLIPATLVAAQGIYNFWFSSGRCCSCSGTSG